MTVNREQQTINFETTETENKKTGKNIITAIAITSSNGLFYKVSNRRNSRSRTNLHLSYKGKVLMDGDIKSSAYRADSFASCKDHLIFQLSPDELADLFLTYTQNIGTIFFEGNQHDMRSCFWVKRKLYIMKDNSDMNKVMVEMSMRHRKLTVMENFVVNNSMAMNVKRSTDLKNKLTLFELYHSRSGVSVFNSLYDAETSIGTFQFTNEPIQMVNNLTLPKYKVLLHDHFVRWTIKNPKGKFETIVNDYGFTDDMSYNQVKKMLRMIKI